MPKLSELTYEDRFNDLLDYILSTQAAAEEHAPVYRELDLIYKRVRRLRDDVLPQMQHRDI